MTAIPCKSCPFRVTTLTEDIPGGGMDHLAAQRTCRPGRHGAVMACHLSTDAEPFACAGWVERVAKPIAWSSGEDAVPMRLALLISQVELREYSDGGAELHPTMAAMLAAHPNPR